MCTFAFWELILTSWSDYSRTPRKNLQENCVCLCILLLHRVSTCPSDLGLYYCSLDVVKLKGLASNGEYSCTFKSLHTCVYPNLFRFVLRCFNLYLWLVHSKRKKKYILKKKNIVQMKLITMATICFTVYIQPP